MEWICEEVDCMTINGKVVSKTLHREQELVRCKDCKHLGYTSSHWFCKWLNRCVDEDWFCADGEQKGD
jgi:uncharacterized protein with PIN domain